MSINQVVLQGNLGKDPDLRYTQSGKAVATISIAVKRNFPTNGEYLSDWINVVFWGKQAETVAKKFQKGSEIIVTGSIQTRSYENNQGQKIYVTEINANSFSFTSGSRQNGGNSQNNGGTGYQNQNTNNYSQNNQNSSSGQYGSDNGQDNFGSSTLDITDDDLPF